MVTKEESIDLIYQKRTYFLELEYKKGNKGLTDLSRFTEIGDTDKINGYTR